MDAIDFDPDNVFLVAVATVVQAALERTGDDSEARFRFFPPAAGDGPGRASGRYLL